MITSVTTGSAVSWPTQSREPQAAAPTENRPDGAAAAQASPYDPADMWERTVDRIEAAEGIEPAPRILPEHTPSLIPPRAQEPAEPDIEPPDKSVMAVDAIEAYREQARLSAELQASQGSSPGASTAPPADSLDTAAATAADLRDIKSAAE